MSSAQKEYGILLLFVLVTTPPSSFVILFFCLRFFLATFLLQAVELLAYSVFGE